jgi:hypothetical protein
VKLFKSRSFICDYYVCNQKKSEFVFQAIKETKCYALTRRFIDELFKKYQKVGDDIKADALTRYKIILKGPVMKQKEEDIEELKQEPGYEEIFEKIDKEEQPQANVTNEQDLRKENSADLHAVLKKKIDGIQEEMGKFAKNINDYVRSCDNEIVAIVDGLNKNNS